MSEAKFNALRAKIVEVEAARDEFRAKLATVYGYGFKLAWVKTAERKKLEAFTKKADKLGDQFYTLLDSISPRSWRTGVAYSWVLTQLTYADAITSGELAVMPQCSFGSQESDMRRLMRPVG